MGRTDLIFVKRLYNNAELTILHLNIICVSHYQSSESHQNVNNYIVPWMVINVSSMTFLSHRGAYSRPEAVTVDL